MKEIFYIIVHDCKVVCPNFKLSSNFGVMFIWALFNLQQDNQKSVIVILKRLEMLNNNQRFQ